MPAPDQVEAPSGSQWWQGSVDTKTWIPAFAGKTEEGNRLRVDVIESWGFEPRNAYISKYK